MGDSGGQEQSLLTWLAEQFDRDEETRASTRRVLGEVGVLVRGPPSPPPHSRPPAVLPPP
jgi:hypothetical protein